MASPSIKIGDRVLIRGDNGEFNHLIIGVVTNRSRSMVYVKFIYLGVEQVDAFNPCDLRLVKRTKVD